MSDLKLIVSSVLVIVGMLHLHAAWIKGSTPQAILGAVVVWMAYQS